MVKRKIIICSESLRLPQSSPASVEKFSIDGEAIIGLLKSNLKTLNTKLVEIEAVGFGGKAEFMAELPFFVMSKFAEYRHVSEGLRIFILALRDSDTNNTNKVSGIRRKLADKIKKMIKEHEFNRVHILFAVQAIEAWILADEQKVNEYLGVTNKIKHVNDPETIDDPKQVVNNIFRECGRKYTSRELLRLLPQLRVTELLRCKHFKELCDCVENIARLA